MLKRAPAPTYGFDIAIIRDTASVVLSTPDYPCDVEDQRHYVGGDAHVQPAIEYGLHFIGALTATGPAEATQPWVFQLGRATIRGYRDLTFCASTTPDLNQAWWNRAVMAGGACQLLTTTGLIAQAIKYQHPEVIHAQGGHRLVGAQIIVHF